MFTQQNGRGRGPVAGRPGFSVLERHAVAVVARMLTSPSHGGVSDSSARGSSASPTAWSVGRSGFTLIEVVVAMAILAFGVVALGASTGHAMTHIQASDLRAERTLVVRQATELLRSSPWSSLESVCDRGLPPLGSGDYSASCAVARPADNLKWVVIETTGPGFVSGRPVPSLMETTSISIVQPVSP